VRVYQFRHIRAEEQCSRAFRGFFTVSLASVRNIFGLRRGLVICGVLALSLVAPAQARADSVEVVVTLKEPPLASLFAKSETLAFSSFARPHRLTLSTPSSRSYLARLATAQRGLQARIRSKIPEARTRWHFGVVLNGFAVVVPRGELDRLAAIPGVEHVWPNRTYRPLLDVTPQLIGATTLWGSTFATAGQGMKIAIVDDGIDQTHPMFAPRGLTYPPGFPKGQTAFTTPKVIVARAFPPPSPRYANSSRPFDPELSEHALHVAGIAAGDENTITRNGFRLSGIAPRAQLGNYKALSVPSQFGLNGNAPELAAAVEAAVKDGMDVINLSLGEPEIEPSRDVVVRALNAAADAGVVSTIAAGNEFDEFGFGSIGSPGSAAKAITAAASTGGHGSIETDAPASYSSAGPTPYSLRFKPDVTAPGSDVASAFPHGGFGELSGTSMAAPHVAGAVALLRQRHPSWSPANVKSALVLTGAPVRVGSREVGPLREGGGRIDLVRADQPLVFASPTSLSFGLLRRSAAATQRISLTDAGGGAGLWTVQVAASYTSAPAQVTVPGTLAVRVAIPRTAREGEVSGFIVLSRGAERRRIPFWFRVVRPQLPRVPHSSLARPGVYRATTARGVSRVTVYRYPEVQSAGFPTRLPGRELAFRVRVRRPANFGVAVLERAAGMTVEPRIVRAGNENRLAGITALPLDVNPYRSTYGRHRLVAGVVLPAPGAYDIVFDTPRTGRPGAFRFRYWVGDTTPPAVRLLGVRGGFVELAVTDRGSGVDPSSIEARIDNSVRPAANGDGRVRIPLGSVARGRHTVTLSVGDYQETKNMEDVKGIRPNTRTFRASFIR
jgi:subtilisin family serine protease